jgi:organic radical activating enzyme
MTNDKIDKIKNAPHGFCLAKWYQVTIDLSRGQTHSCHHPERHKIPLEEILIDPSALHNTQFKMLQRQMMLEGKRPSECDYCWKIEDSSEKSISDRFIKSTNSWAFPLLEETLKLPWNQPVSPTYLEVIFSSECHLSCAYCMADVSSSIEKEMVKFGPYPIASNQHRMPTGPEITHDNPYIKAFWQWFPNILGQLKIFRITGGEPLLSKQFFPVLDYLETHPNPSLELAVNTNLSYLPERLQKLLVQIKVLLAKKAIKKFTLFTSLDGFGDEACYIRKGLDFAKFLDNITKISNSIPETQIVLMCTYNILSISSFRQLLSWVAEKKSFGFNLILDISYLKDPIYLRANLADISLKQQLNDDLIHMKNLPQYSDYEINKFERIVTWVNATNIDNDTHLYRSDFYAFIREFDRRYKLDFLATFPTYRSFFKICEKAYYWSHKSNLSTFHE